MYALDGANTDYDVRHLYKVLCAQCVFRFKIYERLIRRKVRDDRNASWNFALRWYSRIYANNLVNAHKQKTKDTKNVLVPD